MFKLIQGDCIDQMQRLIEDNVKVDLVVTSPPYDNLRTYNDSLNWNFDIFKQVADKLYQIVTDGGVVVWIVNDATINGSETGTSFKQALYFKEIGFNLHDTMIYQKEGISYPSSVRYYSCFEYMFILSKGKPKSINLIQDRPNKKGGDLITSTQRQPDGSIRDSTAKRVKRKIKPIGVRYNIWQYGVGYMKSTKDKIAFQHPAIFPLKLAQDHIISWSNPNDLVLDPFMGSGTTGVACINTNRQFIGIELDKDYYQIAQERCKNYQTKLEV